MKNARASRSDADFSHSPPSGVNLESASHFATIPPSDISIIAETMSLAFNGPINDPSPMPGMIYGRNPMLSMCAAHLSAHGMSVCDVNMATGIMSSNRLL
jgi:hypothetical protein